MEWWSHTSITCGEVSPGAPSAQPADQGVDEASKQKLDAVLLRGSESNGSHVAASSTVRSSVSQLRHSVKQRNVD